MIKSYNILGYYYGAWDDDFVIAGSMEKAIEETRKKSGNPNLGKSALRQDEDVLDTWASSWLFPLQVFKGFNALHFNPGKGVINPTNKDLEYFYPTSTLVTAPEILFFWVARMIIAGYEYTGRKPFKDVYLTGIVKDKKEEKCQSRWVTTRTQLF